MDNVKCRCVIVLLLTGVLHGSQKCQQLRAAVPFGSLERVCSALTPWVPQHSIHPGPLPASQLLGFVFLQPNPVWKQQRELGGAGIFLLLSPCWGWLLSLRWTSLSFRHCPAHSALISDFSLFIERKLMSERELSHWLQQDRRRGHFIHHLPFFNLWCQAL